MVTPASGRVSPDDDGSAELLGILDGDPETYRAWATDYYEREIPSEAVRAIYHFEVLTDRLLASLNPEVAASHVTSDAIEIGYPYKLST